LSTDGDPDECCLKSLDAGEPIATTLTLPCAAPAFVALKGIVHEPTAAPRMAPETRDSLLGAIAKARGWFEDLRLGRAATLAEIAEREGLGERHVRLLTPLAFVAPCIIAAIVDGTALADLTVTGLAKALSYSWVNQERGLSR
jgi:site-specific DNA recombinase